MRHTVGLTALSGLTVLTVTGGASAQTTIRIPRVVNQKPATTTAPSSTAFAYISTPTLRKKVLDAYLADVGRSNPSRGKMLAADFARTDAESFYRGLIKNTGLTSFDVADALTAYNLSGWIIANNVKTLPPRSQIQAVRRQVAASLAKNPNMANMAARGEVGEKFKLLTITLHFGLLSARKSGDTKAYADSVASLFAETDPNPRTLALTNAGFVRKK